MKSEKCHRGARKCARGEPGAVRPRIESCRAVEKVRGLTAPGSPRFIPLVSCLDEKSFTTLRHCRDSKKNGRRGLTLLEIILALAIFFGSLAALSQLAYSGARATVQARLKTQAIIRCEAKLAEVLASAEMLQPKSGVAYLDNPAWTWSLSITPTPYKGLLQVDVMVSHRGNNRRSQTEFNLRRWMREPSQFTTAALKLKESDEKTNGTPPASSSSTTTTK